MDAYDIFTTTTRTPVKRLTTDVAEVTQIISKQRNSVKKAASNDTESIDFRTKENELTIQQYLQQ